jgi:hypothetical protein
MIDKLLLMSKQNDVKYLIDDETADLLRFAYRLDLSQIASFLPKFNGF